MKNWTLDDLKPKLDKLKTGRSYEKGKAAYAAVSCAVCHRFNGDGGGSGPDISGVGSRFQPADLLERREVGQICRGRADFALPVREPLLAPAVNEDRRAARDELARQSPTEAVGGSGDENSLPADRQHGVELGARIGDHHGELAAEHGAAALLVEAREIAPV